ncbi:MAG: ATP-binding protein, partial [Pseudomonadota bacterium]
ELDVAEAIERVRVLMAGVLNRSLALIVVENPSGVERVLFDPLRFSHLVRNLLSNALKFSPSDSVVELRLSRLLDGDALLSVSDRGPGMDLGAIARLGRPADAEDPAWADGMGFAVIRSICAMHDCGFTVENRAGGGLTAAVRIPGARLIEDAEGERRIAT